MPSARLLAASMVAIFPALDEPPKPSLAYKAERPLVRATPAPADYAAAVPVDRCGVRVCTKTRGDQCRYSYDFAAHKYVQRCWGAQHCVAYKVEYKAMCRRDDDSAETGLPASAGADHRAGRRLATLQSVD